MNPKYKNHQEGVQAILEKHPWLRQQAAEHKKNNLTCVPAKAYQKFIISILRNNGYYMAENILDSIISTSYQPYWTEGDLRPHGNSTKPKWVQNVASAKAGLDRRGVVIRYEKLIHKLILRPKRGWTIIKEDNQLYRVTAKVYRILLPNHVIEAVKQWSDRLPQSGKKSYLKLSQPEAKFIVPDAIW